MSLALDWNLDDEESKSKSNNSNKEGGYTDSQDKPLQLNIALSDKASRAYYFGIFVSKQDKIHVAAFRHIKDQQTKEHEWQIFDPRFRSPIGLINNASKYRAWCRKFKEAEFYLLERDP